MDPSILVEAVADVAEEAMIEVVAGAAVEVIVNLEAVPDASSVVKKATFLENAPTPPEMTVSREAETASNAAKRVISRGSAPKEAATSASDVKRRDTFPETALKVVETTVLIANSQDIFQEIAPKRRK